jgi:hypothetical protein
MAEIPDYEDLKISKQRVDEEFDSFDIDDLLEQRIESLLAKCSEAEVQDKAIKRIREVYFNGYS